MESGKFERGFLPLGQQGRRGAFPIIPRSRATKFAVLWGSAVAAVLGSVVLFGAVRFDSVGAGFAYLGGERIIISPATASCGFRQIDGTMTAAGPALDFQIHNATDEPIRLIGATSSCSCLSVVSGIPTSIRPAGVGTISTVVNRTRVASSTSVRLTVFTDSPESPTLEVAVSIRVR